MIGLITGVPGPGVGLVAGVIAAHDIQIAIFIYITRTAL